MSRLSFEITLLEPEEGDDQWEAHFRGLAGYGESADEAMTVLVSEIQELIEDAEYNRVHAPGIHGHNPDRSVPEVQHLDNPTVPQGQRGPDTTPVHPPEPPQDRV